MDWTEDQIAWEADGESLQLGVTRAGEGPVLLMLPALSSISTHKELRPLQERLAKSFSTMAVDWPGFGDLPRPKVNWRPELYRKFLHFLSAETGPFATVAAGHGASYALAQNAEQPGSLGRLVLLSPTWRGPLPTMAGKRLGLFPALAKTVDLPGLGAAFYRLNINKPVIAMMARGHVYSDPDWLTGERMAQKRAVTEAPGARYASFRFVSGELDLFHDRVAWLETASRAGSDILVLYGKAAPPKSKAEMEAFAALGNVEAMVMPRGKLSFYEEFPGDAADAILSRLERS